MADQNNATIAAVAPPPNYAIEDIFIDGIEYYIENNELYANDRYWFSTSYDTRIVDKEQGKEILKKMIEKAPRDQEKYLQYYIEHPEILFPDAPPNILSQSIHAESPGGETTSYWYCTPTEYYAIVGSTLYAYDEDDKETKVTDMKKAIKALKCGLFNTRNSWGTTNKVAFFYKEPTKLKGIVPDPSLTWNEATKEWMDGSNPVTTTPPPPALPPASSPPTVPTPEPGNTPPVPPVPPVSSPPALTTPEPVINQAPSVDNTNTPMTFDELSAMFMANEQQFTGIPYTPSNEEVVPPPNSAETGSVTVIIPEEGREEKRNEIINYYIDRGNTVNQARDLYRRLVSRWDNNQNITIIKEMTGPQGRKVGVADLSYGLDQGPDIELALPTDLRYDGVVFDEAEKKWIAMPLTRAERKALDLDRGIARELGRERRQDSGLFSPNESRSRRRIRRRNNAEDKKASRRDLISILYKQSRQK